MAAYWVLRLSSILGMAATLAVIAGFFVRARVLRADREFDRLRRPADFSKLPSVTIIVPARNAAPYIGPCLESLLALDYPRFDIIVVDDLSTDATADTVHRTIARCPSARNVRLVMVGESADDEETAWAYGKSRALWHGARQALGEWLLFVDADTLQKPDTLWRSLVLVRRHGLGALSMTGISRIPGLWGEILECIVYPAIFLVFPWRRIIDPASPAAWMNGQFLLFERRAYYGIGGHRAVASFIGEDTALAVLSKEKGVRLRFLPVTRAYESHDFENLSQTFHGWTRRLASGGSVLRLPRFSYLFQAVVIFSVGLLPFLTVAASILVPGGGKAVLGASPVAWAFAQVSLLVFFQAALRVAMKTRVWPSLFVPCGAALAIGLIAASYRARFVTKSVESRGRRLRIHETHQ